MPTITISYDTISLPAIEFTSGTAPSAVVGIPYAFAYTATGDSGITFAAYPGLPPGLSLDPSGALAGTPTLQVTYPFIVVAVGSSGARASRQDTISVVLPTISFTSGPPPAGVAGQPYSYQYAATGDAGITFASAGLPPGLVFYSAGLLSGFPVLTGSYPFTVTATGSSGASTSREDIIVIAAPSPAATASPVAVDFGALTVATTSAPQTVNLTNTGTAPLSIGSVALNDPAAGFAIVVDGCSGHLLPPGVACGVDVTFSPTSVGQSTTTLTFYDNAPDSPQSVSLTGAGVAPPAPVASVAPGSVDFGSQTTGTTSAPHVLTLSNTGDGPLTISATSVSGTNAADFGKSADGCTGQTLAPAASCTVSVTFTPSAAGSRSATLQFLDNAADSPQGVPLTGIGVTPMADLAVSIAATPNPVKAGSKVTYTITILNAGPSAALNVLLNDILSSQSTFVSARPSQGTCVTPAPGSSGAVSCNLGSIGNGMTSVTQIVVTVIAKKTLMTNTVTVSTSTSDPNLANNTASITTRVK